MATKDETVRSELKKAGCTKFAFAENGRVVYLPAEFAMANLDLVKELKLTEIKDDTFFRAGRHIQQHNEMIAYQC